MHNMAKKHVSKQSKRALIKLAARETAQESKMIPPISSKTNTTTTADWIAQASEAILEDPQGALQETSKLRHLLKLANDDKDPHAAQLAILSLLAIVQDILPNYRIRLPSTKEMAVKVSKDTQKLWDYERALLQTYQDYLKLLETKWSRYNNNNDATTNHNSTETNNRLAVTCLLCLCELLQHAFHFNFRSNLLTCVIRSMNHSVDHVRQACCHAIEFVLVHDAQGDVALEATRLVAKMIRDRNFKVHACVLQTLRMLPLRVHVDEAQAAQLVAAANSKKRKRDKETAAIEAEMKEGQATVDKIVLARSQSEMLQTVTLLYFRILKGDDLKASHIEQLLPAALEGLAKFSHLINIDTVMDLLDVLKGLLKNVDALPLDAALNCVLTAFQALHGPGKEMKIDQKAYVLPLYSQLPRLCSEEASLKNTDNMIKCLTAAFLKQREISTTRVAAFIKQMLTVALHTPAHTSVPLVALVRQLFLRYPSARQLLENEDDVITSGKYNPEVEDPENSNPFSTSAWELAMLKFHIHPVITAQAVAALNEKIVQLPTESPERLRQELLSSGNDLYIPFQRIQKKHPLTPKESSKRQQVRFITPRHDECIYI